LPVVFIGICSTTLSSVLSYMLGAPRVLQAMARDGIFPMLKPFAGTNNSNSNSNNEPVRAIFFTWLLTQIVILIGDLDLLLPVVTGCFLICFCTVNLTCFILEFSPATAANIRQGKIHLIAFFYFSTSDIGLTILFFLVYMRIHIRNESLSTV
jgi:amino acid transporter